MISVVAGGVLAVLAIGAVVSNVALTGPAGAAGPGSSGEVASSDSLAGAERDTTCEDPAGTATALVVYSHKSLFLAGIDTEFAFDVAVTLELSTDPATLAPTGATVRGELVLLPCSLSGSLKAVDGGGGLDPVAPQHGVLSPGRPLVFHWKWDRIINEVQLELAGLDGGVDFSRRSPLTYAMAVGGDAPASTTTVVASRTVPTTSGSGTTAGTRPTTTAVGPTVPASSVSSESVPVVPPTTAVPSTTTTSAGTGASSTAMESSSTTALPNSDSAIEAALIACDQQIADYMDTRIIYEPNQTMTVGEPKYVEAVVTADLDTAPAVVFGSSPVEVVAEPAVLSCKVNARLEGFDFDIKATNRADESKSVVKGVDARWIWQVKPLRSGPELLLTLVVWGDLGPGRTTNETLIKKPITVTAIAGPSSFPAGPVALAFGATGLVGVAGWRMRRRFRPGSSPAATIDPSAVALLSAAAEVATGRLFVSYSRKDSVVAARFVAVLEGAGFDVWRDTDDIRGGETWRKSIVDGILSARLMVMLLSPNSVASKNVERELSVASEKSKPILPVMIAPSTIDGAFEYLLAGVQIVDLTKSGRTEANRELLREVGAHLSPKFR